MDLPEEFGIVPSGDSAPQSASSDGDERDIDVFVVDDHPAIREAVTTTVNEEPGMTMVGKKASAEKALPSIKQASPDVVVVEISLGGVDGLTLTRRIRTLVPDTRVLVFSIYEASMYAKQAIKAGAWGYLMKTRPTQEVVEAIRRITRGQVHLSQDVLSDILDRVLRSDDEESSEDVQALSPKEMTVFQMLGDGNSVAEIAESLDLSRKTIERYRRQVKEALGFDRVDGLVQYAALWTSDQAPGPVYGPEEGTGPTSGEAVEDIEIAPKGG
jgi:DNA-binding NarL/FixJ family response regulator